MAMTNEPTELGERIQRLVAILVATHPAGVGLRVVGGFRYRLLDRGPRRSVDIDYHWDGDLAAKREELIALCDRLLLPDVRRQFGLDGRVAAAACSGDESVAVATAELAFWKVGSALGRIEIPIDVIRMECLDPPVARTADGIVYRTASDADMIESKVISILMRTFLEHRDLLDLHLFASHLPADAADRIKAKLSRLGADGQQIDRRLADLAGAADRHARALDAVIRDQLDPVAAMTLADCGGGRTVLGEVCGLLGRLFGREESPA